MEAVRMAYAALSPKFPQVNCHKAGPLTKVLLVIVA